MVDDPIEETRRLLAAAGRYWATMPIEVSPELLQALLDRLEAVEREALRDDMPPMIGDPRGGRGPAGW